MSDRKLASVQKIVDIRPIEGADKIETAQLLGWECVIAKKDNFKVGDLVVYIEIDSITPECNEFEFLRERKFRVRTIKLKKQVSQGLVMPLNILNNFTQDISDGYSGTLKAVTDWKEGDDVTDLIGIKKYDPQLTEEQKIIEDKKSKSKVLKFFMGSAIFRWIYFKLTTVEKGWPKWFGRSDEDRIQVCAKIFINNMDKLWYVSEKIDGQSFSAFYHKSKKMGFPHWIFGICSRNIWLRKPNESNYWKLAKKYDLAHKFSDLKKEIVIQAESAGPSIQGNKYNFKENDLYVFNVIINGKRCSLIEMEKICNEMGLKTVPIIDRAFDPKSLGNISEVKDVVQSLVNMSNGKSSFADIPREGLVFRLVENPNISFKVISPDFLLKYQE